MTTIDLIKVSILTSYAVVLFGCGSSESNIAIPSEESKMISVPISFGGEITNITESPMTKTTDASKDLYAFQIYFSPENENNYSYYAYGFFDNKENMIINLKEGYKYKFDVSMVVKGSESVYKFSLAKSGWATIENSFFISSEEYVRYMYEGYLYMKKPYETFNRPNVDRFFGRTIDYKPTEGGKVNINMKRVSFGVKFIAKDFGEGSLEISIEGAPTLSMSAIEGFEIQNIISFNCLESAFLLDDYVEEIPVNIVWVKPDSVRVPIASEKVSFKRNKLTTIEFKVKENSSSNSFNFDATEEMETGETIEIGGTGMNNGVDPQ